MKKFRIWMLADLLTLAKLLPAVALFVFVRTLPIYGAFMLLAVGELLDALDGMAAKKWPHPSWAEHSWMRRHIKLVESGLDMLLAIAAARFCCLRIDWTIWITITVLSALIGMVCELALYGQCFGTPAEGHHKKWSLYGKNPKLARKIVGLRLVIYIGLVGAMLVTLLVCSEWNAVVAISVLIAMVAVCTWILIRKIKDGRFHELF